MSVFVILTTKPGQYRYEIGDSVAQFNPTTSVEPAVGTAIMGATRTATVYNVIGMLGERRGPVPSEWSRATIVVSRWENELDRERLATELQRGALPPAVV